MLSHPMQTDVAVKRSSVFPGGRYGAVKTLQTQDTLDPRHLGTSAEVSVRHFGTSAELPGYIGTTDTSARRKTLWHRATLDQAIEPCILVLHELLFLPNNRRLN